jgi:hypothetical protein
VEIPVSWVSTGGVPGVYGVILDGQLVYANGESETTHSVVSEAFMLYEPLTGLDSVPGIITDASLTGITMISDIFSKGGIFMNIVWINNTGTTSFIPEIYTTFTDNETTDTSTETETQEETEENNETEQEKGILQSIIESIVNFFKGIFG